MTKRCTRSYKRTAMSGSHINRFAHKNQNNNSFYSTSEGQINTFLLLQIKMSNVIGREAERALLGWAIYSARYIRNDMQFGRVVIWNGTNQLLSAEVTSLDGDVMSHHYLFTASFLGSHLTLCCKIQCLKWYLYQQTQHLALIMCSLSV